MPNSSFAHNTKSASQFDLHYPHLDLGNVNQGQWWIWIFLGLLAISVTSLFIIVFLPNTITAAVATVISLCIGAFYLTSCSVGMISLAVAAIKVIIDASDKTNSEHLFSTYGKIEQSDEKQLPSYKEALKKEEQTKLEMNRSQPIFSEQTCLASEASPPYSAFFDFKEYSPFKPISTKPQPDIELTEIKPTVGLCCK